MRFCVQKSFVWSESCSDVRGGSRAASSVSVMGGAGDLLLHRGSKPPAAAAADPSVCPNKHVSFNIRTFNEKVASSSAENKRKVSFKLDDSNCKPKSLHFAFSAEAPENGKCSRVV